MKAKIRATGEIVIVISYIAPYGTQRHCSDSICYIDYTGKEHTNVPMNIHWDMEEIIENTLTTEINWEQRKWDFVSHTLSLYLAENGTQYIQRDRCGNPIGEKDRNFTSIITDYIVVADELINQLKQQSNEK